MQHSSVEFGHLLNFESWLYTYLCSRTESSLYWCHDQLFNEKQLARGICCSISLRHDAVDNMGNLGLNLALFYLRVNVKLIWTL